MGRINIFNRKLSGEETQRMEKILESVLYPETPRKEFVAALRERVLAYSFPEAEGIEKQVKKSIWVLLLSLMGVTIILGVWIRVVLSLSKMINSTQGMRRGSRKRRITAIQPVA
jgi:hypothetical protein